MEYAIDYREKLLEELKDIPEEFIPFIFEQIKACKKNLTARKKSGQSPTQRLLNLAGSLENPERLNAKQYKKKAVDEYLSKTV